MAKHKPEDPVPSEYLENLSKMTEIYNQMVQKALESSEESLSAAPYKNMPKIWSEILSKVMQDPEGLYDKQIQLYGDYMKIWQNAWNRYIGGQEQPLFCADPKDKRFRDTTWNEDLTFDVIKQSYLLTNQWLQNLIHGIPGLDKKTASKFDFYTRQFIDAVSPSNFAFTNPEVIRETIRTKGENLVKGLSNLQHDLEKSRQFLNIQTSDTNAFRPGENIACTPGKVIFRNDLMELIQYTPAQAEAHQLPLLIIPAWINKYYILDLSPHNSLVKWMLNQGFTVFMISWVNPDARLAHKTFDNYMMEGPLAALDAIEKATGQREVTAMGYCLGGTLLACTLAYMKAKNDTRIKAATFLTTMVDFSDVGDMAVFIDEEQVNVLDRQMQETGYMDGSEIAGIFSLIRANDLIWSFVVNNYLLGRAPMPFDILYWNSDATRLPADTHSFYLRNMYLNNSLREPGGITLAKTLIDVTRIDIPTYILATVEDHIAPWQTCFESTGLFHGKNTFVLAGSGHVAGVINPPEKEKYGFYTNNKKSADAKDWLAKAEYTPGSWWPNWSQWNAQFSPARVPAPHPAKAALGEAPGEYIRVRSKVES